MLDFLLPALAIGVLIAVTGLMILSRRRNVRTVGEPTATELPPAASPSSASRRGGDGLDQAEDALTPPPALVSPTGDERSAIAWLQDQFRSEIEQTTGIDISADRMAQQRLLEAIVAALLELRGKPSTTINLPFIAVDAGGPKHFSRELTAIEAEAARA